MPGAEPHGQRALSWREGGVFLWDGGAKPRRFLGELRDGWASSWNLHPFLHAKNRVQSVTPGSAMLPAQPVLQALDASSASLAAEASGNGPELHLPEGPEGAAAGLGWTRRGQGFGFEERFRASPSTSESKHCGIQPLLAAEFRLSHSGISRRSSAPTPSGAEGLGEAQIWRTGALSPTRSILALRSVAKA